MLLSAVASNKDILLTIDNASALVGFVGYRLERKVGDGAWLVWNGAVFSSLGYLAISTTRFADYDVPDGLYQYRYAIDTGVLSAYAYSDWVRIGTTRIGWTFENYSVPSGLYGEILTADDIRYTYLWGVESTASNGDFFTDAQIRNNIRSSVAELERCLKLTIVKRKIKCQPDAALVLGSDYDEAEDPYTYRHDLWTRSGRLVLRRRPVLSLERFDFYAITDQKVLDLLSWARLDHRKGVLSFFPRAGANNQFRIVPPAMTLGLSYMSGDYPHGYKVDYTAGFADAGLLPADLRDIIGKIATLRLLNIVGDGLIAGFSSSSLSMDGVSESFSSTQSAENSYFGARIKVYLKDIETYLKENRTKFGNVTMGSI